MTYLRRVVRDIADGFHAGRSLLWYGHAYPRYYIPAAPSDPGSNG